MDVATQGCRHVVCVGYPPSSVVPTDLRDVAKGSQAETGAFVVAGLIAGKGPWAATTPVADLDEWCRGAQVFANSPRKSTPRLAPSG